MVILKLIAVFFIMIGVMWWKKPLFIALIASTVGACLIFQMTPDKILTAVGKAITSWDTIQLLLVFYLITYLQRMLECRGNLRKAQWALDGLFNNRRVNASIAPALLGLLPAAGTVLLCGDMVRQSTDQYLEHEEQAFVTSYYRHVPELFLPTYTSILIAISLTDGKVEIGSFVLAMLPMAATLMFLGWLFYLRKLPRSAEAKQDSPAGTYIRTLGKSLWTLMLTVGLIIAFHFPVYLAVFICIALNILFERFTAKELLPMFKSAFEAKLMVSTVLIMIFKEILAATGVISVLPDIFSKLPIPTFLVFALIFFFGSVVSGSQAIIVLCMEMAMRTPKQGGLALFVLLMCMSYAAMQLSPVHICLTICSGDFKIPLAALLKKTLPVILTFSGVAFLYYALLIAFGF